MIWEFEKVAGPYKGRTGGLAWDGSAMLFSAVQEERALRFDPGTGKADVFRNYIGRTNGLAIAADGSVFGAQEGGRRVIHLLKDGSTAPTNDLLDGKHHNQPTDVIVDSAGRVWIADPYNGTPPYGSPVYPFPNHASVLRLERDGPRAWKLKRITYDTKGPRSVLLSADEKTLYVADGDVERGDTCQLLAYPVKPDGDIEPVKVLVTFMATERGIEGMCLDSEGNIVACAGWKKSGAGPVIYVISASGTLLETHPAPADMPMRCAFGDAGLASLYVTAGDGGLYRAVATGRKGLQR
ncbi:MAG: SMP-30/gluconolactonase/LRE family protein [Betaproteobacteria bacterium]|nr:SMP-30/gluconolactonase/LRE family protein [Betaproteobacteria bacterium]